MSWFDLARRIPALWQNERTRTQILGGVGMLAGIGAAIASYAFLREPLHVRLDHLTIHLPNATGNLPPSGLRLLHLSDTHFRGANWREQAKIDCIRKACAGLEYDLLIHTGDFLHDDSGLPNVLTLLDALPAPAWVAMRSLATTIIASIATMNSDRVPGPSFKKYTSAQVPRRRASGQWQWQRQSNGNCHAPCAPASCVNGMQRGATA